MSKCYICGDEYNNLHDKCLCCDHIFCINCYNKFKSINLDFDKDKICPCGLIHEGLIISDKYNTKDIHLTSKYMYNLIN